MEIKILDADYTILVLDVINRGNPVGLCDKELCIINIRRKDQCIQSAFNTLWHEIIHVLDYQLRLTKNKENNAYRLACGISQVLRDNSITKSVEDFKDFWEDV